MIEISLAQALAQAGIYDSDTGLERDLKFGHWIANRKYAVVSAGHCTVPPDVEILIIKEKEDVDQS